MFKSDIERFEKRVDRLQEKKRQKKPDEKETVILLDFNRNDNHDPNKVFLLAKIPPRNQWKCK